MAHGITDQDTAWFFRKPAWHGLGTVAQEQPRSIDDALKQMGLDWTIEQHDIITLPTLSQVAGASGSITGRQLRARAGEFAVPGYKANVRSDTGDVLGIVTDRYQPYVNREAFGFAESLLGDMIYETGFSLWGGRQVGLLLRVPESITVGGDEVREYIYLRTRHDGTGSLWVFPTGVRVVCANTDAAAIARAGGPSSELIFKVRHVGDKTAQLHKAREVLQLSVDFGKQFKEVGDQLASEKITERKLAEVLERLYPGGTTDRKANSAKRARDAIMGLFVEGDTIGNAPGSRWSAYQSIIEYDQHVRSVRSTDSRVGAERRFIRSFEDPDGLQRTAFELVTSA